MLSKSSRSARPGLRIDRKGADGLWVLHPFDAGQAVHLASVGLDIGAEQLFAEVDSPAAG